MTNLEFVAKLKKAVDSKTLYVLGCFGAPMNAHNKKRYSNNLAYNKRADRTAKINAASADTFGFDCVCLVKGVLWGWDAIASKNYGGASYQSNGVPDTTIPNLLKNYCTEQSTDFSKIEVGEFLTMDGHCGVYIGDGMAIESTPAWKDGVQITEVWNIKKTSSVGRRWVSHGKLKAVEYVEPTKEEPQVSDKAEIAVCVPATIKSAHITAIENSISGLGYEPKIYMERG